MVRIAGIDIPDKKRIEISLTYIFGIGRARAQKILKEAGVDFNVRTHNLKAEEVNRLQKLIEEYQVEGELRKNIRENIRRLKRIGSYRGLRHSQNLPVRGQRTRSNARTKRGKRKTIGAMKKKDLTKQTNEESH